MNIRQVIPFPGQDALEGLLNQPDGARALFVFAHGAGAGMEHSFMEKSAVLLAERGIASMRFNYPYRTAGRGYPDRPPVLVTASAAAIAFARGLAPEIPLVAGGKSMGGRITANVVAAGIPEIVNGLVFFGYPLHAPGKDSIERAKLLQDVKCPMLFLQGTRDKLARMDLIESVASDLQTATLHSIGDGDHSFKVPKRTGRTHDEVLVELADTVSNWIGNLT